MKILLISKQSDESRLEIINNVDVPTIKTIHDVLIRVESYSINIPLHLWKITHTKCTNLGKVWNGFSGKVEKIGSNVTSLKIGDLVSGVISETDSNNNSAAEFCVIHEFDLVKIPENICNHELTALLPHSVNAFTALHYLGRINLNETILILDGALPARLIMIQLALHLGAKVITTAGSSEERSKLEMMEPHIAQVIELNSTNTHLLVSSVMEETAGVGVDIIVDNAVQLFSLEEDNNKIGDNFSYTVPTKQELISCLTVGGRWITCHPNLQLDPPDSEQLFLRGASVSFLFSSIWQISSSKKGQYQHILKNTIDLVKRRVLTMEKIEKFSMETLTNKFESMNCRDLVPKVMVL